jgi:hypothetical protein
VTSSQHAYEVRARKDHRGADLISDALPFGRLWYGEPNAAGNAVDYAKFYSRSHHAVIRVYDESGNVNETHEHPASSKSGEAGLPSCSFLADIPCMGARNRLQDAI